MEFSLKNVIEVAGLGETEQTDYDDRVTTFKLDNGIDLYYMPLCSGESCDLEYLTNDDLGIECEDIEHLKRLIDISFK